MLWTASTPPATGRVAIAGGAASVGIGLTALVGWASGNRVLLGVRTQYIPMAPNTALGFVLLGAALLALTTGRPRWRWGAGLAAAAVGVVCGFRLVEFAAAQELGVDQIIFHVHAARLGLAPVGRMALSTASAFFAACVAIGLIASGVRTRLSADLAGVSALVTGAAGLVYALGYLFGPSAPLLYGTGSIPMALNTALGLLALSLGLVAANGTQAFPLRRLAVPTTRGRLLRAFLPLIVGATLGAAWLSHLASTLAGAPVAALASAALATAALVLFWPICGRVADRVGQRIDQAEAALQQANEALEATVALRTAALSRSFRELTDAHEALQKSHLELQQTQSRMLQQAKMASLGQTAAGVAHEINNPLACVTSNIAVLKREVGSLHALVCLYQQAEATLAYYQSDLHDQIHDYSERIDLPYVLSNLDSLMDRSRESLHRIKKIVQDLRDFAHLDEADCQEADLNAGILATANLMNTLADHCGVILVADLKPIPRLVCSPAKLNLVVQNLLSNAIDACAPGGRVVITSRPLDAPPGIEIVVADDGTGIDPAIHDRIFDPFFTTKPIGEGTGLGLSMSYGIIKDHDGTIQFETTPGQGTRFTIYIPVPLPDSLRSLDSLAAQAVPGRV